MAIDMTIFRAGESFWNFDHRAFGCWRDEGGFVPSPGLMLGCTSHTDHPRCHAHPTLSLPSLDHPHSHPHGGVGGWRQGRSRGVVSMQGQDYYDILGVSRTASKQVRAPVSSSLSLFSLCLLSPRLSLSRSLSAKW
jgi:hypothetical protein